MITIVGAGLSGLSAAYHFDGDYIVLEKDAVVGGLCRSIKTKGFTFDCAPHIFFTGSQYITDLISELLQGDLARQARRAYIYLNGVYVEYPFEVNLFGLPKNIIDECITEFTDRIKVKPNNFLEWINTTFGSGIARHYMVPYNEKIWKYPLDKMNVEWISGRVPSPNFEEIVKGSKEKIGKEYGPNAYFLYPRIGGIGAIAEAFSKRTDRVSLNSEVKEFCIRDDNQIEVTYDRAGKSIKMLSDSVLSSIPLPELVKNIKNAPENVVKASEELIYNSLLCFNIGVDRPEISKKHWLYFPEKQYVFNRISFPMNLSKETTPAGKSSILVEVTYRGNKPDLEKTKKDIKEGLIEAEILREDDKLDVFNVYNFKYAYVIYDLVHRKNVSIIHRYLKEINIHPIGRFGEWEYLNMDKSIISGKNVAESFGKDKR